MRIETIGASNVAGIEDGAWTLAPQGASFGCGANGAGKSVWLELVEQTRDACLDRHWAENTPRGAAWGGAAQSQRLRGPAGLARTAQAPSVVTLQWSTEGAQWRLEWGWKGKTVASERLHTRAEGAKRWRTALERTTAKESASWRLAQWMKKRPTLRRATRADALASAVAAWIGADPVHGAVRALTTRVRSAETGRAGAERSAAACRDGHACERLLAWMNRHGAVRLEGLALHHGQLIVKREGRDPERGMDAMPRSVRWLWALAAQWTQALDARAVLVLDDIDAHIDGRTCAGLIEEAAAGGMQLIATARGESPGVVVEAR